MPDTWAASWTLAVPLQVARVRSGLNASCCNSYSGSAFLSAVPFGFGRFWGGEERGDVVNCHWFEGSPVSVTGD
jgi:hypothetical protein